MFSSRRNSASRRSKKLDRELKDDFKKRTNQHSILLLGTGESGKTTILKQMKIIHDENGYNQQERLEKVQDIRNNIHESIYSMIAHLNKVRPAIQLHDAAAQKAADFIMNLGETPINDVYTQEYYNLVDYLWHDNDIQEVFHRGNEYHLLDSTEQFMNHLDVIRQRDYVPSDQDILYCRVRTTAITNILFDVKVPKKYGGGVASFSMYDVGGQRGHRRKWISVFENIETVLFIISVGEFDQVLREDGAKNRLEESLDTFSNMFNSRYLQTNNSIVFLNKEDVLEKKIKNGALIGTYFEKYKQFKKAPDEFTNAKLFIQEEVIAITKAENSKREAFVHYTVATNTENIKIIFDSVHKMIIQNALKSLGPL